MKIERREGYQEDPGITPNIEGRRMTMMKTVIRGRGG